MEKLGDNIGSLRVIEGGHFLGKNVNIMTKEAELRIGPKETDIIFNKQKFEGNQYIQIADDEKGNKKITMRGEFIEVDLLKEGLGDNKVIINAKGKNLLVENGKSKYLIDGEGTLRSRFPQSREEVNTEITNDQKPDQKVETRVSEEGSETTIDGNNGKRVCIGGSCTSVSAAGGIGSLFGAKPTPLEGPYDKPEGAIIISKSLVYADVSRVNEFLETLEKETASSGKKLTQEEFTRRLVSYDLGNMYSEGVTHRELDKGDIDENIGKMLKPAGFSASQMREINNFKSGVLKDYDKVPQGTKISFSTSNKGGTVIGTVTLLMPGKKPEILVIGEGEKVRKLFIDSLRSKPWNSEYLWEKYQNPNKQL